MKEDTISIDVRMLNSSGIGSVIKSILEFIHIYYSKVFLIGNKDEILNYYNRLLPDNLEIINCTYPIYSIREKLLLPLLIPAVSIHFTPHFNVPFFSNYLIKFCKSLKS